MARGGLSSDPEIRRRQQEGLERGRAIAAERRRLGLPTKRSERELEQRVIEGGNRGGVQQPGREESGGAPPTPTQRSRRTQRRQRQPTGAPADTPATEDDGVDVALPWYAPAYTGKRNTDVATDTDAGADS